MPAPLIFQTETDSILERQKIFTQVKANIAQTAYYKMVDYNPVGSGVFASTFEWACPDGPSFIFLNGNGEILLNGSAYSSLGADEKAIFHKWLPQFSKQFVIKYNREFGI